ncbi:unnamed protein product [Protopolystoma xenopodis]|uniref:Uncharacterized protein n=1 Tax=Protopolystoma xenopodis TaxID=117903 RepID=A0A3S5CIL0_9PLAT|nr:unnamed protein product [Protopolystoma xenopodis]
MILSKKVFCGATRPLLAPLMATDNLQILHKWLLGWLFLRAEWFFGTTQIHPKHGRASWRWISTTALDPHGFLRDEDVMLSTFMLSNTHMACEYMIVCVAFIYIRGSL